MRRSPVPSGWTAISLESIASPGGLARRNAISRPSGDQRGDLS
jgi:hypothetical protein